MTDHFIRSVASFLNSKVENALMINGAWGKGKTHYIKSKQCEKDINRKVIYTTVFGIKDLKEIDDSIVYQKLKLKGKLGEIAKNKNTKVITSIGKTIGKGLLKRYAGLDDDDFDTLNDAFDEASKVDLSELISISDDQVLVIDDLERLDKSITYHDLFGYISSNFTEGSGIKVLLICNEVFIHEAISSDFRKDEPYQTIKEKTVWRTINFEPKLEMIISEMIKGYGPEFEKSYKEIVPWITRRCVKYKIDNLRTINYTLATLNQLFEINSELHYSDKMMLFCSTLVLVNEYKEGRLLEAIASDVPKKYFEYTQPFLSLTFSKSDEIEIHIQEFSNRYLRFNEGRLYQYLPSVRKLIIDGYLNESEFQAELNEYNKGYIELEPHQKSIEKVRGYIYLEQNDLFSELDKILDYVDSGIYTYYELLEIAEIIEMFKSRGMSTRFTELKVYLGLSIAFDKAKLITEYNSTAKVFRNMTSRVTSPSEEFIDFFNSVRQHHDIQNKELKIKSLSGTYDDILASKEIDKQQFFDFFDKNYDFDIIPLVNHFTSTTKNMNLLRDLFHDSRYITDPLYRMNLFNKDVLKLFRKKMFDNTMDRFTVNLIAVEISSLYIDPLLDKALEEEFPF